MVAPLFWGFIFDEQWLPPCFGALFYLFYLPYCLLVLRLWFWTNVLLLTCCFAHAIT